MILSFVNLTATHSVVKKKRYHKNDGTEIFAYVTLVLLLISYSLVLWLCLKKSPMSMNRYRWFILLNSTNAVLFDVLSTLFHPEFLLPYPIIMVGGVMRDVHLGDTVTHILVSITAFSCYILLYFTMLLFTFRYCQTVDNWFYRTVFLQKKMSLMFTLLGIFGPGCVALGIANSLVASNEEMIDWMRTQNKQVYEKIQGRNFVGLKVIKNTFYIDRTTCCSYSIQYSWLLWFLRIKKHQLSYRTISLYYSLINSLVLDIVIAGFLGFVPVTLLIFGFLFNISWTSLIFTIGLQTSCLYPLIANIILVVYVTPYRKATLLLLSEILCNRPNKVAATQRASLFNNKFLLTKY
uniref:G protein-coupled receptor n=1 Tax=Ditylenchus dipsaci TaxID=166011 RepID=A0A915CUG1_9BILA